MKKHLLLSLTITFFGAAHLTAQTVEAAQALTGQTTAQPLTAVSADTASASTDSIVPVDGFYNYSILGNATPFNYPHINPNNVRFYKRIWRDIDLKDPANQILAIPGNTLIEAVLEGVKSGKITAYNPVDDSFKFKMTPQQAFAKLQDSVLVPVFDDQGNQISEQWKLNDFNPERITKFRVKEDIFFDKQRSKIETRIIGIAPLMSIQTSDVSVAEAPVFWLYFPQCRTVFVKKDVSNPDKNMFDMSMDDIFLQRKFTSTIIRESNTTGQRIVDYTQDSSEQEKEAKRIEAGIEEYKKKVWGYSSSN